MYSQDSLGSDGNGDEEYTLMLYTIKRNIKIININTSKKELTFSSSIELCGEINDRVVITKNNKILLYGYITNIAC